MSQKMTVFMPRKRVRFHDDNTLNPIHDDDSEKKSPSSSV